MLYEIAKPFVMAVVRAVWAPTLSGHENIPEQGPVILASNHLTYADTVFLPGQVRRSVHFLGKSDIFSGRGPIARLLAAIMRGLHVMPVDRSGGGAARIWDATTGRLRHTLTDHTGSVTADCTSATCAGDPCSEPISHTAPTFCIHVPMFDTSCALHSAR